MQENQTKPTFQQLLTTARPSVRTWIFFFAILLVPFFVLSFWNEPGNDDFGYYVDVHRLGVWAFQPYFYTNWTGRYFSNFIEAVNPFTQGWAGFYAWVGVIVLTSWLLALRSLLGVLLRGPFARDEVWLVTLCLFALFLHRLAKVPDSFYWLAGVTSHSLGPIIGLFALAFYLSAVLRPANASTRGLAANVQTRAFAAIALAAASACVVGSNETLMLQWDFFLAWLAFYFFWVRNERLWSLLPSLVVAAAGSLVVIVAPGNSVREHALTGGKNVGLMFVKPLGLMIEIIPRYLSLAGLLSLFVLVALAPELRRRLPAWFLGRRSRLAFILLCLGVLWLTFIPSVWAWGGLPPKRVMNNTYFWMLMTFPVIVVQNSERGFGWLRWLGDKFARVGARAAIVIFAASFLCLFNQGAAWFDLFVRGPRYQREMAERAAILRAHPNEDVVVPALTDPPTTILYEDITPSADRWENASYAKYFGVKSVRVSE